MTEEEAVNVFDLVVKKGGLPAKLDQLVPLSFIGSAAVKFYQAKVKLLDQLGMSEAQRKATLKDGQDAGVMLLGIEARIGELIEPMRLPKAGDRLSESALEKSLKLKATTLKPKQAGNASAIHRNPAAVAAVIKEAKENEDIPTKTAVLNKIAVERMREKLKGKARGKPDINGTLFTYADMMRQINLGMDDVIENWEDIDDEAKQAFMSAIARFATKVEALKEKAAWKKTLSFRVS